MIHRNESGLLVPGEGRVGPWLSSFPMPQTAGKMIVTHDMAGDWLDFRCRPGSDHQRKLSKAKVARYTEQMDAGLWRTTPEGLMFDTEGYNIDGQHRLQALRNSRLDELEFWVFPDEPSDVFPVINTGYNRQARQLYNGSYATIITSAVRYLSEVKGAYVTTMPPVVQLEMVSQWPELETHAAKVTAAYMRARVPGSPHLAIMAQAERTEYRHMIPAWLEGLTFGLDLSAGDSRLHLRNRFLGQVGRQRSSDLVYNTIAKAWNNFALGKRLQVLSWRAEEGMLSVIGTGADMSAGVTLEE